MVKIFAFALLSGAVSASVLSHAFAYEPEQIQQILDVHNRYRAEVGVSPLRWSTILAYHAQEWARYLASRGGALVHSTAKDRPGEGENLWSGWSTNGPSEFKPNNMVNDWANERKYYTGGICPDFSSTGRFGDVGHYTQIVWSATTEVGCGSADVRETRVFVCRYSPPGNIIGKSPY